MKPSRQRQQSSVLMHLPRSRQHTPHDPLHHLRFRQPSSAGGRWLWAMVVGGGWPGLSPAGGGVARRVATATACLLARFWFRLPLARVAIAAIALIATIATN
jgi:hypothetical protein